MVDGALGPNPPAVPGDDPRDERQTDPRSLERTLIVQAHERVEQLGGVRRVEPRAVVADEEGVVLVAHLDVRFLPLRRELECVAEEVVERDPQESRIRVRGHSLLHHDVYLARAGVAEELVDHLARERGDVDFRHHHLRPGQARELEAFCYSVSHDLRAPLRAIDGFSQALLEDFPQDVPDEAKGYLARIRSSTQRMAQLIEDLLNLSKVSRGELQRREVDLGQIAREIVADLRQREPERKVEVSVWEGLKAHADGRLMRAALENLIGNAWKFSARTPAAHIEVGAMRDGDSVTFFVRDNGAGFDMKYANKLFGAFQRLHAASEFQGTGIGLATVQRIVHRHGGRVWADASPGKGAVFYFTLGSPLAAPASELAA